MGRGRMTWMLLAATLYVVPSTSRAASPDDCASRLSYLEQRVEVGAKRSLQWSLGWGIGFGLLTVGQLALSPLLPAEERIDFYVGAGASGVGTLTRAVFIPRVIGHRRRMRRSSPTTGRCERLTLLEEEVGKDAKWERGGRSLVMHGLNLAFNAAVGVVLGVAFDRPVPGNRLAAIGAVVGEVMIITQPTYMIRTVEGYRRLGASALRPAPMVLRGGGGLSLSGRL